MTDPTNPTNMYAMPSVSITTARTGAPAKANAARRAGLFMY